MTFEQLATVKVGDNVRLRESQGRITMTAKTWFMITWQDGNLETVRRAPTILTERLQLEPRP